MVRKGVVGTPILGQKSKHFLFKSDCTQLYLTVRNTQYYTLISFASFAFL